MNNYKVVIVGCTKNNQKCIRSNLLKLVQIGSQFKDYNIIIYENDSMDNTLQQLQEFKSENKNFDFIHETQIENKYSNFRNIDMRAAILTHGRNILLDQVINKYSMYDYMIMIDMDNVLIGFNPQNICEVFKHNVDEWDVITSNCTIKYYDIWALRISNNIWKPEIHGKIWNKPIEHDCWRQITQDIHPTRCVDNYQKFITTTMPLIETDSSFGGLGIYKISKIKNCKYNGFVYNSDGTVKYSQCEHVAFNTDIRKNGGKIFICPTLLMTCPIEHLQSE
jgi:glycosyltransferase involved in cell wall biosynthesis